MLEYANGLVVSLDSSDEPFSSQRPKAPVTAPRMMQPQVVEDNWRGAAYIRRSLQFARGDSTSKLDATQAPDPSRCDSTTHAP